MIIGPPPKFHGTRDNLQLGPLPDLDMASLAVVLLPGLPEMSRSELVRLLQLSNGQPAVLVDYLSLPVVREALLYGGPLPADLAAFTEDGRDDLRHAELSPLDRDTLELLACLGTSTCAAWVASLGLSGERLLKAQATGRVQANLGLSCWWVTRWRG